MKKHTGVKKRVHWSYWNKSLNWSICGTWHHWDPWRSCWKQTKCSAIPPLGCSRTWLQNKITDEVFWANLFSVCHRTLLIRIKTPFLAYHGISANPILVLHSLYHYWHSNQGCYHFQNLCNHSIIWHVLVFRFVTFQVILLGESNLNFP